MLGGFSEIYCRVGRQRRPVLLFWGRNDTTVPFEHSRDLLEAIPHAEFHAIDKCGHIPHYEKAEIVNPTLIRFLKRSPSTSAFDTPLGRRQRRAQDLRSGRFRDRLQK